MEGIPRLIRANGLRSSSPSPTVHTGQAELLGLVLIVGITIVGMSAILVFGSSVLADSRAESQLGSAEHAMTQFDSQASLVALGPSERHRATVPLTGTESQLRVDEDAGWMNVTVHRGSGGTDIAPVVNVTLGAVIYDNGDTRVAYQGGGVWRETPNGSVMISPPEFHYRTTSRGDPTLTLPLVAVSGSGTVSDDLIIEGETTTSEYPVVGSPVRTNPMKEGKVNVTVHGDYYKAWGNFFEERTGGEVTYNHGGNRVTITLVVPVEDDTSVAGGVVAGSAGTTLDIKEGAVVDSYNSSEGDYASTNTEDTKVIAVGDVVLREKATVEGSLEAGEAVTLKESAEITENVQHGDSLTLGEDATIGGWSAQNASVTAPESVEADIDDKRTSFADNNDNASVTATIQDLETGACDSGCTLPAGRYYLDEIELGSGDSLTLDTSGGDIEVVVLDDMTMGESSAIDITGSNRVDVYLEGDFSAKEDATVSIPGDNSTQFWVFMNPGSTASLKEGVTFVGVIYGPGSGAQSGVSVSPTENGEVFGALVGNVGDLKEEHAVHYDEALVNTQAVASGDGGDNTPAITYLHITVNHVQVRNR